MTAIASSDPIDLSHDRLGFAFCLAIALHAALILGISFNQHQRTPAAAKIEITLAQHNSEQAPEQVDFLAQHNQQGSGTLEEKAMLTSQEQADFFDNVIRDVKPQQQRKTSEQQAATLAMVSTTDDRQQQTAIDSREQQTEQKNTRADEMTATERSVEIASLEARLDIQRQAFAKRPRIKRLTSVATKQADDALYLHNWRTRIEAIGNRHYPEQARQHSIYGKLRLLVSLLPNGDVHQVKVLASSGHTLLDEAAIRIVHLAAPYEPFPLSMRNDVDILEIIRTWRFHNNRLTSNS